MALPLQPRRAPGLLATVLFDEVWEPDATPQ